MPHRLHHRFIAPLRVIDPIGEWSLSVGSLGSVRLTNGCHRQRVLAVRPGFGEGRLTTPLRHLARGLERQPWVQVRTRPNRGSQYHQLDGAVRKIDGRGEVGEVVGHGVAGPIQGGLVINGLGRVCYPEPSLSRMSSAATPKYGTIGPRFGLLAGRKDLVNRIRAKGFEFGMEARQALYPAVVRTLEQYDPARSVG